VVAEGGDLTRDYEYIRQLRKAQGLDGSRAACDTGSELRPHGQRAAPPVSLMLELQGHLFDTKMINKVCDLAEEAHGHVEISNILIGRTCSDASSANLVVSAPGPKVLDELLGQIWAAAAEASVRVRRVDGSRAEEEVGRALDVPQRKVLVLGAGFVVGPLVEYLLRQPGVLLTVASVAAAELEPFKERFGGRVRCRVLDVTPSSAEAKAACEAAIEDAELVVSMVPAAFHVPIARMAIQRRRHMVTASYVSGEMEALDAEAKAAGVVIINEVGLDPGIDHMSAMKMIHHATAGGRGQVLEFKSLCGGLPAPEAAGSNPLGYKFSWSPKGVLLAARNPARWKQDGKIREVPGAELLGHSRPMTLNNAFAFDVLPNRDSTVFAGLYGLTEARTFFRGTLRYHGFCDRMLALARLGLLEPGPVDRLRALAGGAPPTRRQWLAALLACGADDVALLAAVSEKVGASLGTLGVDFCKWLGLLSDDALPAESPLDSPVDVTTKLLGRPEMSYHAGERDMVAMYHELLVQLEDGSLERHTATLVEYAKPNGATAMARTVGITAAICAQLILQDAQALGTGVQRPLDRKWYEPVLRRLDDEGIRLEERVERVTSAARL